MNRLGFEPTFGLPAHTIKDFKLHHPYIIQTISEIKTLWEQFFVSFTVIKVYLLKSLGSFFFVKKHLLLTKAAFICLEIVQ